MDPRDPIGHHEALEVVEQLRSAGNHHGDGVVADVDDAPREYAHELDHLGTLTGIGSDTYQQQLSLAGLVGVKLADLDNVDELVQLRHHLLEGSGLDVYDNRDPGEALVVSRRYSEGEDVVATPGEQPRDTCEHAGLVLHQDREQTVPGTAWAL